MRSAFVLALVLLGVPACGDGTCLEGPRAPASGDWVASVTRGDGIFTVVTRGGASYRVPAAPRRIVSTLPGLTETVAALGAADRLVAVSEHCPLPEGAKSPARISVMPIAYELLRPLRPDLVLVDPVLLGGQLEELGRRVPAFLPLESRSLAHLEASVALLARVLGTPAASRAAAEFADDLSRARAQARGAAEGFRVLLLAGADPVYALGPGSLLDDMLAVCGGVNVACDLGRASGPFAAELVRVRRPDWILVTAGDFPPMLRSRWKDLPAVGAGRIHRVDDDAFVRAGPRTPDALRRLAALFRAGDSGADGASR
jgi:ABC-type Fe3+-hydroxamate transport system substrate-binding protein